MIDILIPSFRPDNVEKIRKNIEECSVGHDINLVFDTKTVGTYNAVRKMFNETSGEWIIHMPDDCTVVPGWIDRMMEMMKDPEIYVGGWKTYNWIKHEPCKYYGKNFCAFICIRRDIAIKLGGLMHEKYYCFYGDPDLSMRAYAAGGKVQHLPTYDIYYDDKGDDLKSKNFLEHHDKDKQQFINTWGNFE